MNFLRVSSAARASSWEGGADAEEVLVVGEVVLPMLGEMLVEGGPIEKGEVVALFVVLCVGIVVEGRVCAMLVSMPMGEMSISSWDESRVDDGGRR